LDEKQIFRHAIYGAINLTALTVIVLLMKYSPI